MYEYENELGYRSDELCHHGVKEQRWGVRRWQNEDGSYTAAGRIHYGIGPARKKSDEGSFWTKSNSDQLRTAASAAGRAGKSAASAVTRVGRSAVFKVQAKVAHRKALRRAKQKALEEKKIAEAEEAARKQAITDEAERQRIIRSGTKEESARLIGNATNDELQYVITRLKREAELKQLTAPEIKDAKSKAQKIVDALKSAQTYANTAADTISAVKKLKGSFNGNNTGENEKEKRRKQLLNSGTLADVIKYGGDVLHPGDYKQLVDKFVNKVALEDLSKGVYSKNSDGKKGKKGKSDKNEKDAKSIYDLASRDLFDEDAMFERFVERLKEKEEDK